MSKLATTCGAGDVFELLSRGRMLDVLYILNHSDKAVRFKEFQEVLDISPNTLANRLKDLVDAGLVQRVQSSDDAEQVGYSRTERGRSLGEVIRVARAWANADAARA